MLIKFCHLTDVLLGSLLEIALSLSDVELVAALTLELIDQPSSFALGVAAVGTFISLLLLIPVKKQCRAVAS